MVAYQGQLEFQHEGAGDLGKFVRKALTSEDDPTMRGPGFVVVQPSEGPTLPPHSH